MILISERLEHDGAFYYREILKDGAVIWKNAWEDPIISNDIDMLENEYQTMKANDIISFGHFEENVRRVLKPKRIKPIVPFIPVAIDNVKPNSKGWKDPKILKEKKERKKVAQPKDRIEEDEIKYRTGRDGSKFRRSFP